MPLNEKDIFIEVENIKRQGLRKSDKLFELLGGERLEQIFDKDTIDSIMESFVNDMSLHPFVNGNGLEILEGLLEGNIVGDMEQFYNIKPEYILSLSPEQQVIMAKSLSGNNKSQEELLLASWNNNIKTIACGGEHASPYMLFEIDKNDFNALSKMEKISNDCAIKPQIFIIEDNMQISFYPENKKEEETFYAQLTEAIKSEKEPNLFLMAMQRAEQNNMNLMKMRIDLLEADQKSTLENYEITLEDKIRLEQENEILREENKELNEANAELVKNVSKFKEWTSKIVGKKSRKNNNIEH